MPTHLMAHLQFAAPNAKTQFKNNMENQDYLKMTKQELAYESTLLRLNPENSKKYTGHEIIFKTGVNNIIKKINRVSETGKTIYIDYPDLGDNLEIVRRLVYVIK